MKPPGFEYHAPSTVEEALVLLAELGEEARPLAGGQSLVPMLNFRLLHPTDLVDLNRIASLSYIRREGERLRIGAMTRHYQLETAPELRTGWPLIPEAMQHVAHPQIRNRGTVGGSLAHADPAAELPAAMVALDAEFVIRSVRGERVLAADDFFRGAMTTAIKVGELLVEIRLPPLPPGTGYAFDELSRRRGDFAIVGVAAMLHRGTSGAIDMARLVYTGVGERPVRCKAAEAMLIGEQPRSDLFRRAAQEAACNLAPETDLHATAEYRVAVAVTMTERVLATCSQRAEPLRS